MYGWALALPHLTLLTVAIFKRYSNINICKPTRWSLSTIGTFVPNIMIVSQTVNRIAILKYNYKNKCTNRRFAKFK